MDPRILSIISGVVTAAFAILFASIRMMNGWSEALDFPVLGLLFVISPVATLLVMRSKYDYIGYRTTFVCLFSSTIFCALIYAGTYKYLDAQFHDQTQHFVPPFFGMFITQTLLRLPIDLVVSIFYKRDTGK